MGKDSQKPASGSTVRIWRGPKERLQKVIEARTEKERRMISEAELVSAAVDEFCDKQERKLGI